MKSLSMKLIVTVAVLTFLAVGTELRSAERGPSLTAVGIEHVTVEEAPSASGATQPTTRPAQEATIRVDAATPGRPVSRYLTGACIEDVNHEISGGIYSQLIFGESFQEPPHTVVVQFEK